MPVRKFLESLLSTSCRLVGSQIQYIKLVLNRKVPVQVEPYLLNYIEVSGSINGIHLVSILLASSIGRAK